MPLSALSIPHLTTWTTWDQTRGVGGDMWHNALTPGSTTWPSASRGYMFPIYLDTTVVVNRLFVANGTAVSGNVDAGIYSWNYTRLCRAGSTAQSGTNNLQLLTPDSAIRLTPGRYRFALAIDNTTGTVVRTAHSVYVLRAAGVSQMTSAFSSGLVSTWTPATISSAFLPLAGFTDLTTL